MKNKKTKSAKRRKTKNSGKSKPISRLGRLFQRRATAKIEIPRSAKTLISRPSKNKETKVLKIKVFSKPSEKEVKPNEAGAATFSNDLFPGGESKTKVLRKNALQLKKEAEEMEKEFIAKEQAWEAPAFLRLKTFRNPFNRPPQADEENK